MVLFLLLLSGVCWTIVYIQLIIVGLKDKTYGMPFVALALNFAWEALHSYIGLKFNITKTKLHSDDWSFLDFISIKKHFHFYRDTITLVFVIGKKRWQLFQLPSFCVANKISNT